LQRAAALVEAQDMVRKTVVLRSGEEVAYLERGDGSAGRTLLCLHGMVMDSDAFVPFVAALQLPCSVRVLIPDAMAHGSRIKAALGMGDNFAGWSASERAADAAAFLEAVGDVHGPVDVYGYSMGGATALCLATEHPEAVDRVCLLAPALGFTERAVAETQQGHIVYNYRTAEEAADFLERVGLSPDAASSAAPLMAQQRAATGVGGQFWARMWTGLLAGMGGDAAAMLEGCREKAKRAASAGTAVAVIQGAEDLVVHRAVPSTIEEAMGGAARCRVTILQGFGHYSHPTDPTASFAASAAIPAAAFLTYESEIK